MKVLSQIREQSQKLPFQSKHRTSFFRIRNSTTKTMVEVATITYKNIPKQNEKT